MMKKWLLVFISILVISSAVYFSFINRASYSPNVILISIDTLRQDHVGVYGYERKTTPVLDKVASEGVVFKNSYSTAPWTLPSHMSMFTGLPPSVHKVDTDNRILGDNIKLFTEVLSENGYRTGGFFSALYLKPVYGFSRGFEEYSDQIKKHSDEITDKGITWIETNKDNKFFIFLHYFDVHWPYRPPVDIATKFGVDVLIKKWFKFGKLSYLRNFSDPNIKMNKAVKKKIVNLYDGEIYRVDRSIGRFIEYLKKEGIYDKTIVIITSDHGEEFKEHDSFGHFHQLYSELINVPLIIRFPDKFPKNRYINSPVSSIDIASTILHSANVKVPPQFGKYGKNLFNLTENKINVNDSDNRAILSETKKGGTHHFAFMKNGYKYITPYKYRPLIKKKRWIKVNDKFFNSLSDRSEKYDLLGESRDNLEQKSILDSMKMRISQYVKSNIPGIKISFFSSVDKKENNLTGSVNFNFQPEELPFGVNLGAVDNLLSDTGSNLFNFELTIKNEKKEIIFPYINKLLENKTLTIKVNSEGKSILNKTIELNELYKPILMYKSSKLAIYLSKEGEFFQSKKANLSEKDKNALRTLGYIN